MLDELSEKYIFGYIFYIISKTKLTNQEASLMQKLWCESHCPQLKVKSLTLCFSAFVKVFQPCCLTMYNTD